jgi:fructose-specific phosphotransferase system IIC component
MTQTLDLNKMGLAPMNEMEIQETDGGFWGQLIGGLVTGLVVSLIDNWGDVRAGWADGANHKPRH